MSEVICKECGSKENRWHLGKRSSIPDGRMTLYDCSVIFYLGCEDCSETLKIIHDDDYMEMFDSLESENAKLKAENERLRKALSYYADPSEWSKCDENSHWNLLFNSSHSDGDGYITAKQALEKAEEVESE